VVDAAFVPKKAYQAYVESNGPVRVSLPQVLRSPVKLPGDPWIAVPEGGGPGEDPWRAADVIVANDTSQNLSGARVAVWLEDAAGVRHHDGDAMEITVDLEAGSGWSGQWPGGWARDWRVPAAGGTHFLTAEVRSAQGEALATNRYELVVLDTGFDYLDRLTKTDVRSLLDGARKAEGFHFWVGGSVVHAARPGVRGLANGFRDAQAKGVDLYEAVQGEHLFRHLLWQLDGAAYAEALREEIWRIRSEVLSPREKARVLIRYLELLVVRGDERLGGVAARRPRATTEGSGGGTTAGRPAWVDRAEERPPAPPVGRDIATPVDGRHEEEGR
jgi:hypothetical protein